MKYKIQPGVVLTCVCGEYLLVATRQARGKCPYVQQMNPTGVFYWEMLEKGMNFDDMLQAAWERYDAEREILSAGLTNFLAALKAWGYLLDEEL